MSDLSIGTGISRSLRCAMVANVGSMGIMALLVVGLPRFLSPIDYGYWQVYLFYVLYLGYVSFGLTEGVYLRFGGKNWKDLPRSVMRAHFWTLTGMDLAVFGCGILLYLIYAEDPDYTFALSAAIVGALLYVPRTFLSTLFQVSSRMPDYARAMILERVVMLIGCVGLLVFQIYAFRYFVLADVFGKLCSLVFCLVVGRDVVFSRQRGWSDIARETRLTMSAGLFVLTTSLSAVLVVAVVRIGIERGWGVEIFGRVSLAFTIANMFQAVINAVGITLFPAIIRIPRAEYADAYLRIREVLVPLLLLGLVACLPLTYFLARWAPAYASVGIYLFLLFPLVVFEGRSRMLANVFLNALRRERLVALINVVAMLLAVIGTLAFALLLRNLLACVLVITLVQGVRSTAMEFSVARELKIEFGRDLAVEASLCALFVALHLAEPRWLATLFYPVLGVYLWHHRVALTFVSQRVRRSAA